MTDLDVVRSLQKAVQQERTAQAIMAYLHAALEPFAAHYTSSVQGLPEEKTVLITATVRQLRVAAEAIRRIGRDPVYEENGRWYFWNETWMRREGPFGSAEAARYRLFDYVMSL